MLLGLEDEPALRSGWRELERRVQTAGREWIGVIVQRLVEPGGTDLLVGAIGDPDLGPVLAIGRGGRQAGLSRGAAFRLLPVTDAEADELIDSAEGVATELDGFRGSALLDRAALRELILRFTLLLLQVPEVVEADLNPVRCMTTGCVVLDMRLRIEPRAQSSASRRLRRARHAAPDRARASSRARQDLVTARAGTNERKPGRSNDTLTSRGAQPARAQTQDAAAVTWPR